MKENIKRVLAVCLLLITLSSCSNRSSAVSSSKEEKFQTVMPMPDMNKSLEINVDSDTKIFLVGTKIPILVENKSPHFLFFDLADNYITLFTTNGDEWIEIQNGLTYSGSRVLSPQGTPLLNQDYTWARPAFQDNTFKADKTNMLLRIVMTGEIMEDDVRTGSFVGAYVDVYISP